MQSLLIIGANNVQYTPKQLRSFGNFNAAPRINLYLAVKHDPTALPARQLIPHLCFENSTDAQFFFSLFGAGYQAEQSYTVYSTLPAGYRSGLLSKIFRLDGYGAIMVCSHENEGSMHAYSNRLLRFNLTNIAPGYTPDAIVAWPENTNYYDTLVKYRVYYNPLVRTDQGLMGEDYDNFFFKQSGLPIALPPCYGKQNDTNNYFNDDNIRVRKAIDRVLLQKVSGEILENCLGYKVWKMLDEPVLRDILLDGGYFKLSSVGTKEGIQIEKKFFIEGGSQVSLVLANTTDYIKAWRAQLIGNTVHTDEKGQIGSVLREDILSLLPCFDIKESDQGNQQSNNCDYWKVATPQIHNDSYNDYYKEILLGFANRLPQEERDTVSALINNRGDVDALVAFFDHYIRFPFADDVTHISAWWLFFLELFKEDGRVECFDYFRHRYKDPIEKHPGQPYRVTFRNREQMLALRIWLPSGAFIEEKEEIMI